MKKYLADLLTLIRFVLTIIIFVLTALDGSRFAVFVLFILGELTDAFDGTCASKWPFPKNKVPKYRKYAAKYDMWTDTLFVIATLLFFLVRINLVVGLFLGVSYAIFALIVDFVVYGKLFGHPDDFKPGSLSAKNFSLAKKIVLFRRNIYLALLFTIATWTLYASEAPLPAKIAITIIAVIVSVFLWFFLAQRRHHISRDAVAIEDKLSKS